MLLAYQSNYGNTICTTFMKEKQLSIKKLLYKSTCVCFCVCTCVLVVMCKLFKWYVQCVSYVFVCVFVCVLVCACACLCVFFFAFIICRLHAYVCLMFNVCNCQSAQISKTSKRHELQYFLSLPKMAIKMLI